MLWRAYHSPVMLVYRAGISSYILAVSGYIQGINELLFVFICTVSRCIDPGIEPIEVTLYHNKTHKHIMRLGAHKPTGRSPEPPPFDG